MIYVEYFLCPECGQKNTVEWSDASASPTEIDCVRCRRDVPAAIFFEDGREPSTNCTCSPLNLDAHVEGARFSITKFNGPTSGLGVPDLAEVKAQRIKMVRDDLDAFVATHYDTPAQQALMALMVEALATGNTARLVYASQAISWVKGVITLFYPLRDQILSATTAAEVLAVSFDAMATPPDPMVTIEHALSL
jgi:hypothetical protein